MRSLMKEIIRSRVFPIEDYYLLVQTNYVTSIISEDKRVSYMKIYILVHHSLKSNFF